VYDHNDNHIGNFKDLSASFENGHDPYKRVYDRNEVISPSNDNWVSRSSSVIVNADGK